MTPIYTSRPSRQDHPIGRRVGAVGALTLVLIVAMSSIAVAHPGLRPAEIAAGEPTELELVMEHDCDPVDGEDDPTTTVAIQVPPTIVTAEALPLPGWRTSSETGADGRTTVIEWTVEDGATPETPPTLPLRLTADTASQTNELDLVVAQECASGSYVWGGGDQDEPPVTLTVTPGTNTAPRPEATVSEEPSPSPSPTAAASPNPAPTTDRPTPTMTPTPEDTGTSLGTGLWAPLGAIGGVALIAALLVVVRRRPGG